VKKTVLNHVAIRTCTGHHRQIQYLQMVIGNCLRNSFYSIHRETWTNPPSASAIRKMEYGKAIEKYELDMAQKSGVLAAQHITFETHIGSLKIRGNIDGIGSRDNLFKGMEYKTGGGYYFNKQIWGSYTESGQPRFSNLMQVMLYLDGFKTHAAYPFDECMIIYIDRGTGDTTEFSIKLDCGYPVINGEVNYILNINTIYKRFQKLDNYILYSTLPPCDFHPYYNKDELSKLYKCKKLSKAKYETFMDVGYGCDMECGFCNWLDKCREDNSIL